MRIKLDDGTTVNAVLAKNLPPEWKDAGKVVPIRPRPRRRKKTLAEQLPELWKRIQAKKLVTPAPEVWTQGRLDLK